MCDLLLECKELGLGSRIVRSHLGLEALMVENIEGETLQEFYALNHGEETGIEKWLRFAKGREYDGDEIMLELLSEIYKKLDRIEQKLFATQTPYLPLSKSLKICYLGHEFLCFEEKLGEGEMYYARLDLPIFPNKLIPFYFKMLTPQIAKIIKMGSLHARSYDSYIAECERIEIREKRQEEKE